MKNIKKLFISDIENDMLLHKEYRKWVLKIFDLFCNFSNYAELLNETIKSKKLALPSYNLNAKIFCNQCYVFNNYIYLGFTDDSNNDFWIIQYNSNLIGLYLEEFSVLITRLKSEKLNIIQNILDFKNQYENINKQNALEFGGLYFGSPRPHHFFADHLSALYQYMTLYPIQKLGNTKFYTKEGNIFFPLSEFTNSSIYPVAISDSDMNSFLYKNNKFIFKLARGDQQSYDNYNFSEHLICASTSLGKRDSQLLRILNKLNNSDYVIWIGISSEKRAWFEQKEFIMLIIDYLSRKFKNPTIILDGITSTIDKKNISSSDKRFFSSIRKENQNTNLNLFLISSFQSYQKIVLANNIDFFISNTGADSLYPAKFALVRGIGYSANVFGQNSSHHYRTIKVGSEWIEDHRDQNKNISDPTRVSFSICPYKILELFTKVSTVKNTLHLEIIEGYVSFLKNCDEYSMYSLSNLTDRFKVSMVLKELEYWEPVFKDKTQVKTVKFSAISEASLEVKLSFDLFVYSKKLSTHTVREGKELTLKMTEQSSELKNFKILFKGVGRMKFYDISII